MTWSLRPNFQSRLSEAAERFGTPTYAYDWSEIHGRATRLLEAFRFEDFTCKAFYAIKANPNIQLLRRLRDAGLRFEVCSGGELERAVLAGANGDEILMHGPGKLEADHARAFELGATVMLDALGESERLARIAPRSKVLVRVNPGLEVSTHDHLATGNARSKFGVRLEDVPDAVRQAEALGLDVLGLHMHIGSHIENPNDYAQALERLSQLASVVGHRPVFDMGGGFGIDFQLRPLAELARQAAQAFNAKELWLEPGRFLVATAGVLLVRVLEVKATGRKFAAVDAGMSELIRPMLYGANHPVLSLAQDRSLETLDLAGPACESGDVLARDVRLPSPQRGDLLVLGIAGAYGASMSSNYLTRPRPCEVLLEPDEQGAEHWQVLRRRESVLDILRAELEA